MIETDRLTLRAWREEDAPAMAELGRDARVMTFLGPLTGPAEAQQLVAGQQLNQSVFGHCFWAMERRGDRRLLGYCGLNPGPKDTPVADDIEIGWKLTYDAWGQGFAREAATAALAWAWANTARERVMAMTVPANRRSWGLMERLGMTRVPGGDFDHPALAPGDPLRRHVTYAIDRPAQGRGSEPATVAITADSRSPSTVARAASASSVG